MNPWLVSSIHKFIKLSVVDYHLSLALMFSMESTTRYHHSTWKLEKVMSNLTSGKGYTIIKMLPTN